MVSALPACGNGTLPFTPVRLRALENVIVLISVEGGQTTRARSSSKDYIMPLIPKSFIDQPPLLPVKCSPFWGGTQQLVTSRTAVLVRGHLPSTEMQSSREWNRVAVL